MSLGVTTCELRGHNCFLKANQVNINLICPPIIVSHSFCKLLCVYLLLTLIVNLPSLFYRQPSSIFSLFNPSGTHTRFSFPLRQTEKPICKCRRYTFMTAAKIRLQMHFCFLLSLWRKKRRQPCGTAAVTDKCVILHSIHIVFLSTAAPRIWMSGAIKGSQIHLDVMHLQSAGIQYHLTLQYPSCSFASHSIAITSFDKESVWLKCNLILQHNELKIVLMYGICLMVN